MDSGTAQWLLLEATGDSPAVAFMSLPSGERLPLPLGVDDSYGFDHAMSRTSWVMVHVGYQVVALRDGDHLHPMRLPDAWTVEPAADPALVLVNRFYGRSRGPRERGVVELCDGAGRVLRSSSIDNENVIGELSEGPLVTRNGLFSWTGERSSLPTQGAAIAVLGGGVIVMHGSGLVTAFDVRSGTARSCHVPASSLFLRGAYDADANRVAFDGLGDSILVVDAQNGPRLIEVGFEVGSVVWLDDELLLATGERETIVVSVAEGHAHMRQRISIQCWPRLCVTGRFSVPSTTP